MSDSENRDKLVDQLWKESEKARLLKIELEELESLQVRASDTIRWEDFNTGQAKMKSPEGLKDVIAAGLDCQIGSKKKELDLTLQRILELLNPSTSDKADRHSVGTNNADIGSQKGPSSLVKVIAESKQVQQQIGEFDNP